MARGACILSLVALLLLPSVASARVLGLAGSSHRAQRAVPTMMGNSVASGMNTSGRSLDLHVVLAAHGGGFVAYGGGMRAAPRFGAGRFGGPGFRRFPSHVYPFRPYRFRPFIAFSFPVPLYAPYYPYYWYYPYNPYCDPASAYFYPPWCPY